MSVTDTAVQERTLPARAYRDPEVLQAEQDHVFARAWTLVCHQSHVAAPGAYFATSIASEPVVVLRGDDGVLRALSNVCRHRAMRLLGGTGSCSKVIRCPYHGWTYRQDGQLAGVPEARGFVDLDREEVRLPQFAVGVLGGLVFVSLDPEAGPLETYFGELGERICALGIDRLVPLGPYEATYRGNWKNIADNFLEGYHIPVGHPGLLRLLDYKRYLATPGTRHTWIDGPFRAKPSRNWLERTYQRLVRPMPGFPGELKSAWTYAHMWPSTMLDVYPDQIDTWQLSPLGVDRTRTTGWIFASPDEGVRDRVVRRLNRHINRLVMREDDVLTSAVQDGLESRTYERGLLNRNENAIAHFHGMLREAVPGIDDP